MRIGIGYDIHRLIEGRKLILGGVEIPFSKGLLGHSDADVLIHAICDALLGAIACKDIGEHFPDTDDIFKNADSSGLLRQVAKIVEDKGYKIINIDTIIMLEKPKLTLYKEKIRNNISEILNIKCQDINIKAKTEEQTRNTDTIAAQAVVLLNKTGDK